MYQHFKEFQHPWLEKKKQKSDAAATAANAPSNNPSADVTDATSVPTAATPSTDNDGKLHKTLSERAQLRAELEEMKRKLEEQTKQPAVSGSSGVIDAYRTIVKLAVADGTVNPDEKRMLRGYRKEHNITEEQHVSVLKELGWTEDEYDDGEKKQTEQLHPQEAVLLSKGGFGLISLKTGNKLTSLEENIFATAAAHFYQTMSNSGSNFSVVEISMIVHADMQKSFNDTLEKLGTAAKEEWAFHGTSADSIKEISRTGFKLGSALPPSTKCGASLVTSVPVPTKGKKKSTAVTPAADACLSSGIHFAFSVDSALRYATARGNTHQVLLCRVLRGKCAKTKETSLHTVNCPDGYDSVFSDAANELVIYSPSMCLPRFILTYKTQTAKERQQEY